MLVKSAALAADNSDKLLRPEDSPHHHKHPAHITFVAIGKPAKHYVNHIRQQVK